jgi:hypothetical protein
MGFGSIVSWLAWSYGQMFPKYAVVKRGLLLFIIIAHENIRTFPERELQAKHKIIFSTKRVKMYIPKLWPNNKCKHNTKK